MGDGKEVNITKSGNWQFNRFVEVEIRDYEGKIKTTIGNEFSIDFEYFKSLDQTNEDDTGVIKVYGLTPERIKTLQNEGGEVILRCGYVDSEIKTLFVASIARLYYDTENNTTVTTIQCSANLDSYYITGTTPSVKNEWSFFELLRSFSVINGVEDIYISLPDNLPDIDAITEFIGYARVNYSAISSGIDIARQAAEMFGFDFKFPNRNDPENNATVFTLNSNGVALIRKHISKGYVKVSWADKEPVDDKTKNKIKIINSLYETDESDNYAVVLLPESGLISVKTEYKIANAYADQDLAPNEDETDESKQKRAESAAKEELRQEKEAQKKAEALRNGKKYTPPKPKEKRLVPIKINRKYKRVTALLNPNVLPQSIVLLPIDLDDVASDITPNMKIIPIQDVRTQKSIGLLGHRVRTAKYKGNNKSGDWIMELYCEDTGYNSSSEVYRMQLRNVNPESVEDETEDSLDGGDLDSEL